MSEHADPELTEPDRRFLRRAIELAWQARREGERPFGSVLVDGQGNIVAERFNTAIRDRDISAHPELKLAVEAARLLTPEERRRATLYTSTDQVATAVDAPTQFLLGRANYPVTVVGPVLSDEGLAVHRDYWH